MMKKAALLLMCIVPSLVTTTALAAPAQWRNDIVGVNSGGGLQWGSWSKMIYCPEGTYAGGYTMRVEPPQGGGDDTALNAVALYCYDRAGNFVERIEPHSGNWGFWGEGANCQRSSFMNAFNLKVEAPQGGGDDTAANSVEFWCNNGTLALAANGGPWGDWQGWKFGPPNSAICGIAALVEPPQGSGDDTALNDITVHYCRL